MKFRNISRRNNVNTETGKRSWVRWPEPVEGALVTSSEKRHMHFSWCGNRKQQAGELFPVPVPSMCGGHALEWGRSLRCFDLLETRRCAVLCFNQSILMVTNCRTHQQLVLEENSMNTKQRVTQDMFVVLECHVLVFTHTIKEHYCLEGRESSPKNIYKTCIIFFFSFFQ